MSSDSESDSSDNDSLNSTYSSDNSGSDTSDSDNSGSDNSDSDNSGNDNSDNELKDDLDSDIELKDDLDSTNELKDDLDSDISVNELKDYLDSTNELKGDLNSESDSIPYDDSSEDIDVSEINTVEHFSDYENNIGKTVEHFSDYENNIGKTEEHFSDNKLNLTPFKNRKNFILCFYYIKPVSTYEELENLKYAMLKTLEQIYIFDKKKIDIYFIQSDRQKLKIRVFCPSIILDTIQFMTVRCGILKALETDKYSILIPIDMHELEGTPHIFITKNKDVKTNKLESYEKFKCFSHPELKTEYLEKKILEWSFYDIKRKKTLLTTQYKKYIDSTELSYINILENRNTQKSINLFNIDKDIKKDFKGNYDNCIIWFNKYHPDSKLSSLQKINDGYFLNFTKSNYECRLCKLIHNSNRQFLKYNCRKQFTSYHCFDEDAVGKKLLKYFLN